MPEPLDRAAFLHQVADAVDLQPAVVGEVLEELNSHLSDAAAGWREAGYDFEDAERRAIRGLGDPEALGQGLGKARHERRDLLAAVGGGIFNAIGFGLWAYVFLWVVIGGWGLISLIAAMTLVRAAGWQDGSWLTGSAGSVGTVAITTLWFAWLGWALPWRVARSAKRSVRGVRRAVGIAGFAVGSLAVWAVVPVKMDPILALGLPLGPFAFLAASQHAAEGPFMFPPTTLRQRLGLAAVVTLAVAVVGLLTITPNGESGSWEADSSRIGGPADGQLLEAVQMSSWSASTDVGQVGFNVGFADEGTAASMASLYPTLSAEAWPAEVRDGMLVFGPAPIATSNALTPADGTDASLTIDLPMYRTPINVSSFLVAVRADGSRVLLIGPDGLIPSPPWHGTLLDWWFGPR